MAEILKIIIPLIVGIPSAIKVYHEIKCSKKDFPVDCGEIEKDSDSFFEGSKYISRLNKTEKVEKYVSQLITYRKCRSERPEMIALLIVSILLLFMAKFLHATVEGCEDPLLKDMLTCEVGLLYILSLFVLFFSLVGLVHGSFTFLGSFCVWLGSHEYKKDGNLKLTVTKMEEQLRINQCNWTLIGTFNPNGENFNRDYSHILPNQWKRSVEENWEEWKDLEVYVFGETKKEAQRLQELFRVLGIKSFTLGGDSRDSFTRQSFFRRLEYLKICGLEGLGDIPKYVEPKDLVCENIESVDIEGVEIVKATKWKLVISFYNGEINGKNFKTYRLVRKSQLNMFPNMNTKIKTLANLEIVEGNLIDKNCYYKDSQIKVPLKDVYRVSDAI